MVFANLFFRSFLILLFPYVDFKPDLVLLSAGFDAHEDDPTSASKMRIEDFEYFTSKLKGLADKHSNGRLVSVMEGGYNVDALRTFRKKWKFAATSAVKRLEYLRGLLSVLEADMRRSSNASN